MFRRSVGLCALLAVLLTGSLAWAATGSGDTAFWISSGGGVFSDSGNWDTAAVPGEDDVAVFALGASSAYTVTFDSSVSNSQLAINTDQVLFDLNGYTYSLLYDSHAMIVADTDLDYAVLTITDGTIETYRVDIGLWGGTGELTVASDGSLVVETELLVGTYGSGYLIVEGAVSTTASSGWVTVGENDGSYGQITVASGGSLEAEAAPIVIGDWGIGEMTIGESATVVSSGELFLGFSGSSSSGTVYIDGEGASYTSNSDYTSVVGGFGSGMLQISNGGSMSCKGMTIAESSGSLGMVDVLSGGTLSVTNLFCVGSEGGGSLSVSYGTVAIGEAYSDFSVLSEGYVYVGSGGELKGTGTVNADVVLNESGIIRPGNSPGLLMLVADYVQESSGELAITVAGTDRGFTYSGLDVDGDVTLAGILTITFEDDYTPTEGDTFDLISFTGTLTYGTNLFDAIYLFGADDWADAWAYQLDVIDNSSGSGVLRLTSLNTVPEPAAMTLVGLGLLACLRRRRR